MSAAEDMALSKGRTVILVQCLYCRNDRFMDQKKPKVMFNLGLVAITCGIWLPVYLWNLLLAKVRPWRCRGCGHRFPRILDATESTGGSRQPSHPTVTE